MELQQMDSTRGDGTGKIDELIEWLLRQRQSGATVYEFEWSHDPIWAFKWLRVYREKSDEELRLEKIKKLEDEILKLKSVK